jgi:hypothetical protein
MLWFGILASTIVSTLVIEALQDGDYFTFHGLWEVALIGVPAAMVVIGLLTAGVGHVKQVSMQKRRRKRLPHPALATTAPSPAASRRAPLGRVRSSSRSSL